MTSNLHRPFKERRFHRSGFGHLSRGLAMFSICFSGILCLGCSSNDETIQSDVEKLQQLSSRPGINIIVISFDALRADALGVYGFPQPTSPEIDSFSETSVVFDRAYSAAPVTPTSFASAFTGLLPTRVFHRWDLTWSDTLASRFAANGYLTSAFLNNLQLSTERHFDTGFSHYEVLSSRPDEEVLQSSLAWLREHRGEKVFSWIHFLSPHAPYERRELAQHLYDPSYAGQYERTTKGRFETNDPKEIRRIRSLYDGEVLYADTLFGELLDELREIGYLEDSIIVVTSDHGEEFMEHGGFQHDRLTEEHVRIPLLLYHPDLTSGWRSDVLVSNVDFLPTLLALAGLDFDESIDGRDLTSLAEPPNRTVAVSMTGGKERWLSLRRNDLKLILTCLPEQAARLFDLETDPRELTDIAADRGSEVRSLLEELDVILGGDACTMMQAAVSGADPTRGMTDETIEALKALGYLGGS